MQRVMATIRDLNGIVLLSGITAEIQFIRRGNLAEWGGGFQAPYEVNIDIGGSYRLTTTSGQSGEILVNRMNVGSRTGGRLIEFRGNGPFG